MIREFFSDSSSDPLDNRQGSEAGLTRMFPGSCFFKIFRLNPDPRAQDTTVVFMDLTPKELALLSDQLGPYGPRYILPEQEAVFIATEKDAQQARQDLDKKT
jgi:hypothetical protein